MSQPQLLLASGSPRRKDLLAEAGYDFRVLAPREGVEQAGLCSGCGPAELVIDLATRKLDDVVTRIGAEGRPLLVLAADTVAECGGQILGKPTDSDHAAAMMAALSGRRHRVYTGIALARLADLGAERLATEAVVTTLRMDTLTPDWIESYADSGAWEGKAGGFGYQDGLGFVHVESGSESNVVGLPMERVAQLLAAAGCFPRRVRQA